MDNLSTVDKIAGPDVSFIKRLHCITCTHVQKSIVLRYYDGRLMKYVLLLKLPKYINSRLMNWVHTVQDWVYMVCTGLSVHGTGMGVHCTGMGVRSTVLDVHCTGMGVRGRGMGVHGTGMDVRGTGMGVHGRGLSVRTLYRDGCTW